jgi:hypothetical protein
MMQEGFFMEKICPICNKIISSTIKCGKCGSLMNDIGREQEYRDPYGNKQEIEYINSCCVHIFHCDNCGEEAEKSIQDLYI